MPMTLLDDYTRWHQPFTLSAEPALCHSLLYALFSCIIPFTYSMLSLAVMMIMAVTYFMVAYLASHPFLLLYAMAVFLV